MFIIVCEINKTIATFEHCWTAGISGRTAKFEQRQEAKQYVRKNQLTKVKIIEAYSEEYRQFFRLTR